MSSTAQPYEEIVRFPAIRDVRGAEARGLQGGRQFATPLSTQKACERAVGLQPIGGTPSRDRKSRLEHIEKKLEMAPPTSAGIAMHWMLQ